MSREASPFHCPYCGEQDLWPHEAEAARPDGDGSPVRGAWECRGCLRAFTVRMLGMVRPSGAPR